MKLFKLSIGVTILVLCVSLYSVHTIQAQTVNTSSDNLQEELDSFFIDIDKLESTESKYDLLFEVRQKKVKIITNSLLFIDSLENLVKIPANDKPASTRNKLSERDTNNLQLLCKYDSATNNLNKYGAAIEEEQRILNELSDIKQGYQNSKVKKGKKVSKSLATFQGSKTVNFKGIKLNLFTCSTDSNTVKLHWKNTSGKNFENLGNVLGYLNASKTEVLMLTNGGMYNPNAEPQGLYIEKKKILRPLDTTKPKNSGNFYMQPNGVFYVESGGKCKIDSTDRFAYLLYKKGIKPEYATQSGPMLVRGGKINSNFTKNSTNRKLRSGVGIAASGKVVFVISEGDINFYDFALFFKEVFGCNNALFLDGVVSRMYLKDFKSNEKGGDFGPIISVTKIAKTK